MGDSYQAFQELTSLDNKNGRPVFIYLTTSDEQAAQKIETYENSILVNEKFCIAAKFFDCYQVDLEEIEENHPIRKLIKKPKPLTFHTLHKGKILYSSKVKPSSSNLFSICEKTLKKSFKVSLSKIAKEEQKLLDQIDKVQMELNQIEELRIRKGKNLSKKTDLSLRKKEQELFEKEMALRDKEKELLNITLQDKKKQGKDKTAALKR